MPKPRPVVLSIAGYDPSSGAGVTADIKTIAGNGCYGITCMTAITVQSTLGVKRVEPLEGSLITEILNELAGDLDIAAVKIGMLGSAEAARAVAAFLKRSQARNVVLDPVLKSSSGATLLTQEGVQVLKERLLGGASVITPNLDEAAALTGLRVGNLEEMEEAARQLQRAGARNVIITGGHLNPPVDLIRVQGKGPAVTMKGTRIDRGATHGTGCAFSTALACNLALGRALLDSAKAAKQYVESALKSAPRLGRGIGPVV
ncbi:MAG TPA: bifunctional hydroxymethylpyrimidine kinase/phosphomethylpyrimidine kinase [Candidatus Angelobacter sp.]|nr:bifunctional hydroxymethylpyrimidine kinase/phosphomethylpyrimidine kinase [Candidatus Angelobacter sp.]